MHERRRTRSRGLSVVKTASEIGFRVPQLSVREDEGKIVVFVMRTGDLSCEHWVEFETADGTATAGEDYENMEGTMIFKKDVKVMEIEIPIVHDDKVEDDEFFSVVLKNARCGNPNEKGASVKLSANKICTITIIDVSSPGVLGFPSTTYACTERVGEVEIPVLRTEGSMDVVSVFYSTRAGTAEPGKDYVHTSGTLVFEDHEMEKIIKVQIIDNHEVEDRNRDFNILLTKPTKASLDKAKSTINVAITDDEDYSRFVNEVFDMLSAGHSLETHSWREQFKDAMECHAEDTTTMILHIINFPWKVLFACIPPTSYYNGYLTFLCSLAAVGAVTFVIGELASSFGCMVGLDEGVVAMTIVALGTSMPDTFASITATK
eukprot:UN25552